MTVKELMDGLATLPPDTVVLKQTRDAEGEFHEDDLAMDFDLVDAVRVEGNTTPFHSLPGTWETWPNTRTFPVKALVI